MQTKSILTSWTFWFGIAQIAYGAVGYFAGQLDSGTAWALIASGAGSIGFRLKTTTPVTVSLPK